MNHTSLNLCDEVKLLPNQSKPAADIAMRILESDNLRSIVANLGNEYYLVSGYGPKVHSSELQLINKFKAI